MNEIKEFLRQMPFFRTMTEEELDTVTKKCKVKKFQTDDTILLENMPGKGLHMIKQGAVAISKKGKFEKEQDIAVIKENEFFGEMSLIDNAPISATVYAAVDSEIVIIEPADFKYFLNAEPGISFKLVLGIARVLTKRIRETEERIIHSCL